MAEAGCCGAQPPSSNPIPAQPCKVICRSKHLECLPLHTDAGYINLRSGILEFSTRSPHSSPGGAATKLPGGHLRMISLLQASFEPQSKDSDETRPYPVSRPHPLPRHLRNLLSGSCTSIAVYINLHQVSVGALRGRSPRLNHPVAPSMISPP